MALRMLIMVLVVLSPRAASAQRGGDPGEILITLIDAFGDPGELRATWEVPDGVAATVRLRSSGSTVLSGVEVPGSDVVGLPDIVWIRGVDLPGGQPGHRRLGEITIRGAGGDTGDLLVLVSRELGCISDAPWFESGGPWGGGLPRGGCVTGDLIEHGWLIGQSSIDDWDGLLVRRPGNTWVKAAINGALLGTIERSAQGWLSVALGSRELVSDSWLGEARVAANIVCDELQALFIGHELAANIDAGSLTGPVIIGADGGEPNVWASSATLTIPRGDLRPLVLTGASQAYAFDASTFGGGSITFADHDPDCTSGSTSYGVQRTEPAFTERRSFLSPFGGGCIPAYVIESAKPPVELVVHHYGPLFSGGTLACTGCCDGSDAAHAADFYAVYRRRARTVDAGFSETGWHPGAFTDSGGTNTHWDVDDFAFYHSDLGTHWEVVTDDFAVRAGDEANLVSTLQRTYTARPLAGAFEDGYEYVFASNNFGYICPDVVHASYSHRLGKAGSGPPESGNGYFVALTVEDSCRGDVNRDGVVDDADLAEVMANLGSVVGVANGGQYDWVPAADGTWGTVDGLDVADVTSNFGPCN